MPKFKLTTTSEVLVHHEIEADSAADALEMVNGAIRRTTDDYGDYVVEPCTDFKAEIDVSDEWRLPDISEVKQVTK